MKALSNGTIDDAIAYAYHIVSILKERI